MVEKYILITGSSGFIGSELKKYLKNKTYKLLLPNSKELDLTSFKKSSKYFKSIKSKKIAVIFHLAAVYNSSLWSKNNDGESFYRNCNINLNLFELVRIFFHNTKVISTSSYLIYNNENKTHKETDIFNGNLGDNLFGYASSKLSMLYNIVSYNKQYKANYKCLILPTVVGPLENISKKSFFYETIQKIKTSKKNNSNLIMYGSGNEVRNFVHVKDVIYALEILAFTDSKFSFYNFGFNKSMKISDFVRELSTNLGFKNKIIFEKRESKRIDVKNIDSTRFFSEFKFKNTVIPFKFN